jgi:tRNA pseudouridine38-40 synthase
MTRRIVGVLVEIGRGALEPAAATAFLNVASEAPARLTAPPSGLFLDRVYYGREAREAPLQAITPLR